MRNIELGISLIKDVEKLKLTAYPDAFTGGRPWTIGYGRAHGVKRGQRITVPQAEQFLREDVQVAVDAINRLVKVPLNDNQFSALVSLVYNIGIGGFARSQILKAINRGESKQSVASRFVIQNRRLSARRAREAALFLS